YDGRADRQKTGITLAKSGYRPLDDCLRPMSRGSLNVLAVARRQPQFLQRQGFGHGNDSHHAVGGPWPLRHRLHGDITAFHRLLLSRFSLLFLRHDFTSAARLRIRRIRWSRPIMPSSRPSSITGTWATFFSSINLIASSSSVSGETE